MQSTAIYFFLEGKGTWKGNSTRTIGIWWNGEISLHPLSLSILNISSYRNIISIKELDEEETIDSMK